MNTDNAVGLAVVLSKNALPIGSEFFLTCACEKIIGTYLSTDHCRKRISS